MVSDPRLELRDARRILAAGEEKAVALGVAMALCVSDAAGEPVVLARMDGASIAAVRSVAAKARTAVHFGRPTSETVDRSRVDPTVYASFMTVGQGDWVLSMGGVPLLADGVVVGAVAASGGSGDEDVAVAEAAASAWTGLR